MLACLWPAVVKSCIAARKHQPGSWMCTQVSLDLASFEVVNNNHSTLLRWMQKGLLDLVFCNLEEAQALAQVWTHAAAASLTIQAASDVGAQSMLICARRQPFVWLQ